MHFGKTFNNNNHNSFVIRPSFEFLHPRIRFYERQCRRLTCGMSILILYKIQMEKKSSVPKCLPPKLNYKIINITSYVQYECSRLTDRRGSGSLQDDYFMLILFASPGDITGGTSFSGCVPHNQMVTITSVYGTYDTTFAHCTFNHRRVLGPNNKNGEFKFEKI